MFHLADTVTPAWLSPIFGDGYSRHVVSESLVNVIANPVRVAQTAQSLETPIPCTLIIDEFSNFITEHFNTILSEARKYGMSLVIATQHLEQIPTGSAKRVP